MNTRNGHQRNLSENSEADDLFNFDIKKDKTPKRVNTNSGQRPTFGDLKFFNITPNNSANMDNEELLLAPALLTKTPLTEVPKSETLKTPTNKSGRRTPTLRKRKASEDAETPAKLAKVDTDDAFVTPKATPAARSSVKRKLLKIDEEMPVLQAEEQLSDSVTAVNDQENVSQSGGRPRRSAAVKAAAAITLAATPSTSSITTPKTKSRPKSKKEDTKVVEEESSSRGTSELDEANREGDIAYDKIFNELQFILTSAARNSSSSTFVKKEVRKQIESRGGNVVETFESMNPDLTTYLIADTFYRTHKYLTALSLSVPTVSFKWINKCVEENKLVDYNDFMLDAGESETTGEVYKWQSLKGKILGGKKVAVYSKRGTAPTNNGIDFCQIWSPIVVNLGGELIDGYPSEIEKAVEFFKNRDTTDYFIADDATPQELINAVTEGNGVPVSSEWIIQTIITGVVAATSGNESYVLHPEY